MSSRREPTRSTTRAGRDPLGHPSARRLDPPSSIPWAYFLAFLVGTALVLVAIWYHIDNQRRETVANWKGRVSTIADDRSRLVANWLNARRADAEVLAGFPSVRALLSGPSRGDDSVIQVLNRVASAYGYTAITIYDGQGRWVARSNGAADLAPENPELIAAVARGRQFKIDLSGEKTGRRVLTIAVPIFADGAPGRGEAAANRPVLGVVSLRMKPETELFPLLTDETVPTQTGETLLFRLDGTEPTYLSPLRHTPAGWAAMSRSLETLRDLAKGAQAGKDTFVELTDYRAVPTFAAIRSVPPAGWGLVLKIDRDEALKGFHQAGQLAGAAAAFLLLALAGLLISLYRQQQRAHLLKAQMRQERAIFNLKGYAEKIVASVPSGLLVLSAEMRILSANRSFFESFQLHQDDVIGRDLQEVVRAEGLTRRAREVLQTGAPQHDVLFDLYVNARQETRPVRITMTGIRMAEEEPARLLLIVEDLTEEERLQAAHQASEQRFRDLVQGLDAIVWEADAATLKFSFVSQRAETILGYGVDRWLRERDFWVTRIHPDDRERCMKICREAVAKATDHEFEYRSIVADGREIWLRDIVHVVTDSDGRPAQLRGLTVDLTELRRSEEALRQSEEQLRQAQKMDAVGKLAGGIAHDFNNLLMVIRGDSDLILRRLPQAHPLRQNAEGIREASEQAATLTRQLLAFSRKQVVAPQVLDINTIVGGIHKMLQRLIGETINLVTVTAPDLGPVKADPGQVEQMILNLAVNGRDAMPDGGRLTLRTANVELDEATARRRGNAKPGQYVMLEVSDTGVGMDSETKSHIFEPFFTTKDQGKGTGLGLSTVYGIVNQSGGHVWVESEPGRGTTFRVYLPRIEVPAEAKAPATPMRRREDFAAQRLQMEPPVPVAVAPPAAPPAPAPTAPPARRREDPAPPPPPPPPVEVPVAAVTPIETPIVDDGPKTARGETILLVEDAQRVRAVVREILEMNGYGVLEARHGAEALEISGKHPGPIHLMVTDVVMPQMSGRELAQRLAPLRPEMRVLYMSGYTDDAIVRHGVLGAGMAFLSKPFTPDALAAKVREVLDSARAGAVNNGNVGPGRPEAVAQVERSEGLGSKPSRV
ncbi:MAG TPA: ATP-binding protein [Methylomirabilota bacterium]|nr:ATP-binding protein [Methylomirabilota bacterium]